MARSKGSASLAASLEVLAGAPLDARLVVSEFSDLTAADAYPYSYIGMVVSVKSEEKQYMLIGADTTDEDNWKALGSGGGGGTDSYSDLSNKPQINGTTLNGNKTSSDLGLQEAFQLAEMPTADAEYEGKLVQYIGDSTQDYIKGYFYQCIEESGAYLWENKNVQPDGSGGTSDYDELLNKPSINGVTLSGNSTTSDLGISIPTSVSELVNDEGYITGVAVEDISDVELSSIQDGDVLKYSVSSNTWVNGPDNATVVSLDDVGDVNLTSLQNGDVIKWDSENEEWVNSATGGGSYTAGDGIDISEEDVISTDNLQEGDMDDIITPLPTPGGGVDLDDLGNVNITDPTDGQALVYDETNDEWVNGAGGSGDASLESAVTSNLAVGAIANGTTLAQGTTFTEFVQKLLITEIAPTIGFSISKSGNVAQGTSYTETLTVNVSNMGTAKKIKTIEWYEGSTLKQTDTIDSTTTGSWTYTMDTATTATTTFKAIVKYTKSNDADDQQTKTASITFYFNKFYGGVSDLNPTEATVETLTSALATGKGGTYSFTVSAGRICYAYPKSLGALTSIKDGNGFSLFDSFTRTEQTYTQASQSVVYYRYVLTDPTTVSGYSVIFA